MPIATDFRANSATQRFPDSNTFGEDFRFNGFSLPGGRRVFPVAVKVNLTDSSAADSSGLPKAVVDEIELLAGGTLGKKTSYFVEQYVIDGGRPGLPRDAWLAFDLSGKRSNDRIKATVGQWSLPLPVEVESERDTLAHYAVYDQIVGANTFRFFDPRLGVDVSFASERSGVEAHLDAVAAHDPQSGVPNSGTDLFATVSGRPGPVTVGTYRYVGKRNGIAGTDAFWRQGFALQFERTKLRVTGVLQTGDDATVDGLHAFSGHSSGGFLETTYDSSTALRFVGRYDRTSDAFSVNVSQMVFAVVMRPRRNMRFTVEDLISGGHHSLTSGLLFAY